MNMSLFSSCDFGLVYVSNVSFFPALWSINCLSVPSKKQNHLIRNTSIGRALIKRSSFSMSKGMLLRNKNSEKELSCV